jgi:hypothetical protein
MAVVTQTILDGPRNVVVKIASTGSDTDQIVVDVSALSPACTKLTLEQIWGSIAEGGLATLSVTSRAEARLTVIIVALAVSLTTPVLVLLVMFFSPRRLMQAPTSCRLRKLA